MSIDPAFTSVLTLGWEQIHRDARALAARLAGLGPFKGLVAVTRGGLVPAAILGRELDIRLIETACVASYGDGFRLELAVLKPPTCDAGGAGWLVVDDLVDTGATIAALRPLLPDAHYCALYAKPAGAAQLDSVVAAIDQAVWIVFPWDVPEAE